MLSIKDDLRGVVVGQIQLHLYPHYVHQACTEPLWTRYVLTPHYAVVCLRSLPIGRVKFVAWDGICLFICRRGLIPFVLGVGWWRIRSVFALLSPPTISTLLCLFPSLSPTSLSLSLPLSHTLYTLSHSPTLSPTLSLSRYLSLPPFPSPYLSPSLVRSWSLLFTQSSHRCLAHSNFPYLTVLFPFSPHVQLLLFTPAILLTKVFLKPTHPFLLFFCHCHGPYTTQVCWCHASPAHLSLNWCHIYVSATTIAATITSN